MRFIAYFLAYFLICTLLQPAHAADKTNLLTRPDVAFLQDQSLGIDPGGVTRIKDEKPETATRISVSAQNPVEIIFGFGGAIVTPSEVRVMVSGLKENEAQIEILVSELGPETGFVSLRAEPLKVMDGSQVFRFEPYAAKWLMIKVVAFGESSSFDLAELDVQGHEGPPVSLYAFDEAPADALAVIQSLQQANLRLDIHPDEKSLFEDAADGQLDSWRFAEAALLSSGMYDADLRAKYLAYIDEVIAYVKNDTQGQTPFQKGQRLLTLLHEGPMKNGYVEKQTDTPKVLETGTFNCVSSATLYNIIARGIGLDVRGIEVPDHAFSILYDGTQHADVETTTVRGFNPARNKAGLSEFERTTGFTYISDRNRSKRREIGETGMVALTYYNHGVSATNDGDYPTALLHYFRALSLDPRNKSAIKNTLAVLGRWSSTSMDQQDYPRAIEILDAGLRFAPSDYGMRHNMRYALTNALKQAQTEEARLYFVALSKELHTRTNDNAFLRVQSQALTEQAFEYAKRGDYETALVLTTSLGPEVDERTGRDLKRLRGSLFLNWSNELVAQRDFVTAVDLLERALTETDADYRVKNNLAYAVQQWGKAVAASEGRQAAQTLLIGMSKRFPKIRALQSVAARNYDAEAKAAYDAGNFEAAIAIYKSAHEIGVDERRMKRNEIAVWSQWGLGLLKQGDPAGALTVFERGIAAHPKEYGFKQNVVYIVQEATAGIARSEGILKGEAAIAAHRARFADMSRLDQLQGRFVNEAVNAAQTAQDFEALAPVVLEASVFAAGQYRYDKMVAYFYQQWARTSDPELASEDALAILQSGVDAFPENKDQRRLFVGSVNNFAAPMMEAGDWPGALKIYRKASESLSQERSFLRAIKSIEAQQ